MTVINSNDVMRLKIIRSKNYVLNSRICTYSSVKGTTQLPASFYWDFAVQTKATSQLDRQPVSFCCQGTFTRYPILTYFDYFLFRWIPKMHHFTNWIWIRYAMHEKKMLIMVQFSPRISSFTKNTVDDVPSNKIDNNCIRFEINFCHNF